jgi:amidophosphoribosyltransferase
MGEVKSKCGIFGAHSLHDVYNGLIGLQHRGQDAAGISCIKSDGKIDVLRWAGRVKDLSLKTASKLLNGGRFYLGEVRYSTNKGKTEGDLIGGGLPRYLGGKISIKYELPYLPHILVTGADYAIAHNGHFNGVLSRGEDTDTDVALKYYAMQEKYGVENLMKTFPAAYASAIFDYRFEGVIAFRDRYGIRPLWKGEKDGRIVISSEDKAIVDIGGNPFREISPGEILKIPFHGTVVEKKRLIKTNRYPCFFERMYLGHPLSSYEGMVNKDTRRRAGVALVKEMKEEGFCFDNIDFISYIPESPEDYARAAADYMNLPFLDVFYKIDSKRSFICPDQEHREKSIKENLCIDSRINLKGLRGLFVEDSIVRFTNGFDAAVKLDEKEIGWKGLLVATPPLGVIVDGVKSYCGNGVDMPIDDNFAILRYENIESMARENGWDYLKYLSKSSLEKRALRNPLNRFCAKCIGEGDPVSIDELKGLDKVVEDVYRYWDNK